MVSIDEWLKPSLHKNIGTNSPTLIKTLPKNEWPKQNTETVKEQPIGNEENRHSANGITPKRVTIWHLNASKTKTKNMTKKISLLKKKEKQIL